MDQVIIQSKRDSNRIEVISQETWGQMVELKLHRNWKVIQSIEPLEITEPIKSVEMTIKDFIAKKQPKEKTKTK